MTAKPKNSFVEVVVDQYLDRVLDYILPPSFSLPEPGTFAEVPLKHQTATACILKVKNESSLPSEKLRPLLRLLEDTPPLSPALLKLCRWTSNYYACPLGMVIKSAVPGFVFKKRREKKEMVPDLNAPPQFQPLSLNPHQLAAYEEIKAGLQSAQKQVCLLWGVTGSGKTEVYLQAIQEALYRNLSALVIVPEIALTPQLVDIFKKRFADRIAVFHSRLTEAERAWYWKKTCSGEIRIALGARSAIFAPLKNLGLIIVDEEHEKTYKQEESPRYNARDLAVVRGQIENAQVVLCSATPSLESFHHCMTGKYKLLELPSRVSSRTMPKISLINMKRDMKTSLGIYLFSRELLSAISTRLERKEQTILFLNRRGFSTCQICRECGHTLQCPSCSILLTYHKNDHRMKCHRCETSLVPSNVCPSCNAPAMKFIGFGTEKVEKQIQAIFPQARTARLDSDTVKKKGVLEKVCQDFHERKTDILIGTQMIAKGLHFEGVTLVGVLSGDLSLNLPDFRAGESTFQLLTQVAGRAGRGDIAGEVIIQTHAPRHPVFHYALSHDYKAFYEYEITLRRSLKYPPFSRFILLTISHSKEKTARDNAFWIYEQFHNAVKDKNVQISIPHPAPIEKIKTLFRFQILIVSQKIKQHSFILQQLIRNSDSSLQRTISLDIDPYSLL